MKYATTGFTTTAITTLENLLKKHLNTHPDITFTFRKLTLNDCLQLTSRSLRKNYTQAELAGFYHVSQRTISRALTWTIPILHTILKTFKTTAWHAARTYGKILIDGTLCPTWNWKKPTDNYSGKHRKAGYSIQIITNLRGDIVHITTPVPGSTHDAQAFTTSTLIGNINKNRLIGDKGYTGVLKHTLLRKPTHHKKTHQSPQNSQRIN